MEHLAVVVVACHYRHWPAAFSRIEGQKLPFLVARVLSFYGDSRLEVMGIVSISFVADIAVLWWLVEVSFSLVLSRVLVAFRSVTFLRVFASPSPI